MNHLSAILWIGFGGGLGAIVRYLNTLLVNRVWQYPFPLATFSTNIIGSFLIGFLAAWLLPKIGDSMLLKYFLITGFCGGYTTYSTFSLENLQLIQDGKFFTAALYVGCTLFIGILLTFLGLMVGKSLS